MSLGTIRRSPGASGWPFPASPESLLSSGGSLCSTGRMEAEGDHFKEVTWGCREVIKGLKEVTWGLGRLFEGSES